MNRSAIWSMIDGRTVPHIQPVTDRFGTSDRIGKIVERDPSLWNVFLAFGFHPRANPLLRRAIAPYNTLEGACRLVHVDPRHLVRVLNTALEQQAARPCRSRA
jgi:hypothetical protein